MQKKVGAEMLFTRMQLLLLVRFVTVCGVNAILVSGTIFLPHHIELLNWSCKYELQCVLGVSQGCLIWYWALNRSVNLTWGVALALPQTILLVVVHVVAEVAQRTIPMDWEDDAVLALMCFGSSGMFLMLSMPVMIAVLIVSKIAIGRFGANYRFSLFDVFVLVLAFGTSFGLLRMLEPAKDWYWRSFLIGWNWTWDTAFFLQWIFVTGCACAVSLLSLACSRRDGHQRLTYMIFGLSSCLVGNILCDVSICIVAETPYISTYFVVSCIKALAFCLLSVFMHLVFAWTFDLGDKVQQPI